MYVKLHKKVNKTYGTAVLLSSEAVCILTATAHIFRSVMEIEIYLKCSVRVHNI